jgi:hypothetical protein
MSSRRESVSESALISPPRRRDSGVTSPSSGVPLKLISRDVSPVGSPSLEVAGQKNYITGDSKLVLGRKGWLMTFHTRPLGSMLPCAVSSPPPHGVNLVRSHSHSNHALKTSQTCFGTRSPAALARVQATPPTLGAN